MQKKLSGPKIDTTDPLDGVVGSKKHLSYFPTITSSLDRYPHTHKGSKNKHEFKLGCYESNE